MTETTTPVSQAVQGYLRFWNTEPGDEQVRLGETVFRPDVEYHAPVGVRVGVGELSHLAREFAEHLGQLRFLARNEPDGHHDRVRLRWEIRRGADSFAEGTDVLELDADGRVATVVTFLDRAPEGFDAHHQ